MWNDRLGVFLDLEFAEALQHTLYNSGVYLDSIKSIIPDDVNLLDHPLGRAMANLEEADEIMRSICKSAREDIERLHRDNKDG